LVIDAHVVTHGALTIGGLTSLAVGMIMLFHNAPAPYHTSLPLVLSITLTLGAFWAFALTKAVQVRRRPVTVGPNRVVGFDAIVRTPGQVFVAGELWRAIVFRLGRLLPEPKGPGLFLLIPIVDRMVKVDLRTITLNIPPQEVITKDNVPVRVNAVAYFRIVEPKDAIVQVENFMVA